MQGLLRALRQDSRGVAVTEFAIWATLFFFGVMAALDFGDFYIKRGQLNDALAVSTVGAFQNRDNVAFADIQAEVRNMAQSQSLTVTVTCNGGPAACTNSSRTCACLLTNGNYAAAASCGATCTGGGVTANSTAGYYLTVTATRPYSPMILPSGVLGGGSIRQSATVRLQ